MSAAAWNHPLPGERHAGHLVADLHQLRLCEAVVEEKLFVAPAAAVVVEHLLALLDVRDRPENDLAIGRLPLDGLARLVVEQVKQGQQTPDSRPSGSRGRRRACAGAAAP